MGMRSIIFTNAAGNTFATTDKQIAELWEFIDEAAANGPHFRSMTYEQGMEAVLRFLQQDMTLEEVTR